jgi:hypothetical protein
MMKAGDQFQKVGDEEHLGRQIGEDRRAGLAHVERPLRGAAAGIQRGRGRVLLTGLV